MNRTQAIDLLTDAIMDPTALAGLTTAPTREQMIAIGSASSDDVASFRVCRALDLPEGSSWVAVVEAITSDVGSKVYAALADD